MNKGAIATLPEKSEKRQLSSEDQAVLAFFTAMTEQLAKEKGELTKAAIVNAALLAAPSAVRDEICHALKEMPSLPSDKKSKEPTDLTVPTALVSTGALYLVKKKAIPLLAKGVPAALSFIPGAAAVPYMIEVAEFATEFGGELVKGYVGKHEVDQNKKIFNAADNQFSQLSNLLKAQPSTHKPTETMLPQVPVLTFSKPTLPLLTYLTPKNDQSEESLKKEEKVSFKALDSLK